MDFREVINPKLSSKRGQVTIFIIIGVVIIAAVALFFILRGNLSPTTQIPTEFQPAYNTFLTCLQNTVQSGINILESQGGYIYLPAFQPGSQYMPFSSQLNFLGNPIPYWYYVSGNNIAQQQVPSLSSMQSQLAQYINQNIRNCDFGNYYSQDFAIQMGDPSATTTINSNQVTINLNMNMAMSRGNETATVNSHKVTVNSGLGTLYQSALTVYNYEQQNLFLENYTIDALRNYAPVDGVKITCGPLTWSAPDVVSNLSNAITENIISLHSGSDANYFSVHVPVQNLRFITDSSWPHDYEVNPTNGHLMIAQPIGNQNGLGVLGFCYVPYHFVYDVKYPVLATITSNGETFQFPMAVIVQGNMPRTPLNGTATSTTSPVLCQNENTPETVNVFDAFSNNINANISYECFSESCDIGAAQGGTLTANFPQCDNGYVVASADGYKTGRFLFTTTKTGTVSIILNKLYNESIDLRVDGAAYNGNAIINFISSDGTTQTIAYPQQKSIQLSEADYTIQVYIYKNSSISIAATTTQQCVNTPSGGIGGLLGGTQQQCFNINIPAQVLSNALAGGGTVDYFALETNLQTSNTIQINAQSLPSPTSLNQLQNNYLLFGNQTLGVNLAQNAQ